MKRIKEWFAYYDFQLAAQTAAVLTAAAAFLAAVIMAGVSNDAKWLWLWAVTIILGSAAAGTL